VTRATLWRRRAAGLSAAAVAAILAAGCGGTPSNGEAAKPARQILTDASKATGGASSVRVAGKGSVNGLALRVDVVDGRGRGGGTIGIGGSTLQLVLDGPDFFLKTTPEVIQQLTGSQQTANEDANKWLQTSSSNQSVAALLPLLDITKLATTSFSFAGVPTKQAATTFRGQRAIPVVDAQSGDTIYVAATGKPYILGVRGPASSGGSTLDFTDYDRAPIPPAPSGATELVPPGA
jgi:hypothetical protein